jgi:phosphate transport system substrate-binding protein
MFKRIAMLVLMVALAAAALVGCQPKAETIQIAGSTSMQKLNEVWAEKFMEDNENIIVNVTGGGSGAGITAVTEGTAQIGASSRALKQEEKDAGLTETQVAIDGVVIVVNRDNPVNDLTIEQVRKIYTGEYTNWNQVGGNDAPIAVVTREAGSGTLDAFENIVMNKQEIMTNANTQNATNGVRAVVQGDPNAIGFISLGSLNNDVKGLKIDGVEATEDNIRNGSYAIWRPFVFATKGQLNDATQKFVDFVLSDAGQNIAVQEGFYKK